MVNRIANYFRKAKDSTENPHPPEEENLVRSVAAAWIDSLERNVRNHPGQWLAGAFALGVVVAWWIKRK